MANEPISGFPDGSPAQATDQIPVNRGGTNYRVNAGTIGRGGVVYATNYGVKGGAKQAVGAVFNGTTTVTTGSQDPPFTASDVGSICFGTNVSSTQCNTSGSVLLGASAPYPTILTVNGSHSVTVSAAATGSANPGYFVWGPQDDGPALQAAFNAAVANPGFDLELPAGGMLIGNPIVNTTSIAGTTGGYNYEVLGGTVNGTGENSTILFPLPGLDMTGITTPAFFGLPGVQGLVYSNFTIDGCGITTITGGTSKVALYAGDGGGVFNVTLLQYGMNTSGFISISAFGSVGGMARIDNVVIYAFGTLVKLWGGVVVTGLYASAGAVNVWTQDPSEYVWTYGCQFTNHIGGYTSTMEGPGCWFSYGDTFWSSSVSHGIEIGDGSSAVALFTDVIITAGYANGIGLYIASATAIVHLKGATKITGPLHSIYGISGTLIIDDAGPIAGIGSNTSLSGVSVFAPVAPVGTSLVAGNLVLSTNWGTGKSISAVSGGNSPIQFTIQNGTDTTGASPTVTYTFPIPYLVAPLWVNAVQIGGTNAVGTFVVSSLTATGCVLTFSLTPTANDTEIVQLQVLTQ